MTLTRSLPTQHASGLPLIDERRITAGRYARNSDGTARVGVLPAHTNPLVTGRASMGYDVAAFNAVTSRTTAGAEEIANDAVTIVTTTAAPGSNSRIDVIWVRSQFQVLGDANNDVVFGVTQGTAAVSPTKPAIPAGALELATATIPSTATTTLSSGVVITQTHTYTATAGGVVLFRSLADLTAWAAGEGALARDVSTGDLYKRVGATWLSQEGASRLLVPSSVTGGTISANGVVLLSGGDTVTINGVFTSRFKRYRMVSFWKTGATGSTNNGAFLRLTSGGTPATSGYDSQTSIANGTGNVTGAYAPGGSAFSATSAVGTSHSFDFLLFNPGHAEQTMMQGFANTLPAGLSGIGGTHTPATAYDGIRLELTTKVGQAFAAGEIAIYGMA